MSNRQNQVVLGAMINLGGSGTVRQITDKVNNPEFRLSGRYVFNTLKWMLDKNPPLVRITGDLWAVTDEGRAFYRKRK